jgi:hypothetical protein
MPPKRPRLAAAAKRPKVSVTLAQAATFSVCEAFLRFSSQVAPVTATVVKRKPSKQVPSIKADDMSDDAQSIISDF